MLGALISRMDESTKSDITNGDGLSYGRGWQVHYRLHQVRVTTTVNQLAKGSPFKRTPGEMMLFHKYLFRNEGVFQNFQKCDVEIGNGLWLWLRERRRSPLVFGCKVFGMRVAARCANFLGGSPSVQRMAGGGQKRDVGPPNGKLRTFAPRELTPRRKRAESLINSWGCDVMH